MPNELEVLGLFLEEYDKAKEELAKDKETGVDNMMNDIFVTDKTSVHVFEGDELVGIYTKETGVPKIHVEGDGADRDGDFVFSDEELTNTRLLVRDYSHKPNGNEARFKKITKEMVELYSRKNTDYGGSFDESLDEDGLLVAKIRMKDKLNRFSQLIDNDILVKDESIRDTLIDLANYSIMTLMWMNDENY